MIKHLLAGAIAALTIASAAIAQEYDGPPPMEGDYSYNSRTGVISGQDVVGHFNRNTGDSTVWRGDKICISHYNAGTGTNSTMCD